MQDYLPIVDGCEDDSVELRRHRHHHHHHHYEDNELEGSALNVFQVRRKLTTLPLGCGNLFPLIDLFLKINSEDESDQYDYEMNEGDEEEEENEDDFESDPIEELQDMIDVMEAVAEHEAAKGESSEDASPEYRGESSYKP